MPSVRVGCTHRSFKSRSRLRPRQTGFLWSRPPAICSSKRSQASASPMRRILPPWSPFFAATMLRISLEPLLSWTAGGQHSDRQRTPMTRRKLNLALQGGGSHGAYAWGVLDRLLEEEDVQLHGVSGTSAGAM